MADNTVNTTRITGMVSGFDTDKMVKDLMKAERLKLNKVEQQKQITEWKQEAYREIISGLDSFKSEYFDILNSENNFRSPETFADYNSTAKINGVDTDVVSISGDSNIISLNHTIQSIEQLAQVEIREGTQQKTSIDGTLDLSDPANITALNDNITTNGNKQFSLIFDATAHIISLDETGYTDLNDLTSDLQTKIDDAIGSNKIDVKNDGTNLSFDFTGANAEGGHMAKLLDLDDNVLSSMGFSNGDKNYIQTNGTIADEFGMTAGEAISLEINGVSDFGITTDDTVSEMMNKINSSTAGVKVSYSSLENKFVLQGQETGEINSIDITDTDSFLTNHLKIGAATQSAQDSIVTIDNIRTSRSTNDFTIDGVNYELKETYNESNDPIDPIEVELNNNTDGMVDKIKEFVETYNGLIKTINTKTEEKRYYDFAPLTDEQKEAMSDDEVKLWEGKAKSGLLRSDSALNKITQDMRRALYESVQDVGISLKDIGITTTDSYVDKGKLEIDETKLKTAINNNMDKIKDLFTKQSDISYSDTANRSQRYQEQGLANRLHDIIQDNVRITRDTAGNKGLLVEKAGKEDLSSEDNMLAKKLDDYDSRIEDLEDYLFDREEYYYNMFAKMEAALAQMQSQTSWMQQNM